MNSKFSRNISGEKNFAKTDRFLGIAYDAVLFLLRYRYTMVDLDGLILWIAVLMIGAYLAAFACVLPAVFLQGIFRAARR